MENKSLNPEGQFMARAILKSGEVIDQFYIEDEIVKERHIKKIIDNEDISEFGIVGQNQYLKLDTEKKIFEVLKNTIGVELIDKEGRNLLDMEGKAKKLICFTTNQQIISPGNGAVIQDVPIRHTFGFKIENEHVFAKVKVAIDKERGVILINDITAKYDLEAEFNIIANGGNFAKKDIVFKNNKTNTIDVKLF